jgi:hypothetical protein
MTPEDQLRFGLEGQKIGPMKAVAATSHEASRNLQGAIGTASLAAQSTLRTWELHESLPCTIFCFTPPLA